MKDLNAVQLTGRLGQDPDVQYSGSGTARTTFSVATNRSWTDSDGQVQTETEWSRCVSWGKLAEIAAQYAHKGSRVYVAGWLHTSHWEDAQTGKPRASVEIVVGDLILLDRLTPAGSTKDELDVGEPQRTPSMPVPAPQPAAQQPIRRPARPVQIPEAMARPSKVPPKRPLTPLA